MAARAHLSSRARPIGSRFGRLVWSAWVVGPRTEAPGPRGLKVTARRRRRQRTHAENMRWTALLTAAALVVAAVWLAGASPGRAAGNSVRIEPPEAIVTSGGGSQVGPGAQPPARVPSPAP